MANTKDPSKLYDSLKNIVDNLEDIRNTIEETVSKSRDLVQLSATFGGVIASTMKEQINNSFITDLQNVNDTISSIINDDKKSGSIKSLINFLDSIPLSMIRDESILTDETSVVDTNNSVQTPSEPKEEDELPQNASFVNGTSVKESLKSKLNKLNKLSRKRESVRGGTNAFIENIMNYVDTKINGKWKNLNNLIINKISLSKNFNSLSKAIEDYIRTEKLCKLNGEECKKALIEFYSVVGDECQKINTMSDNGAVNKFIEIMIQYLPKCYKMKTGEELCDKLKESTKYRVLKTSNLSTDDNAECVSEFDNEDDANKLAKTLSDKLTSVEKDDFNFNYIVTPYEFTDDTQGVNLKTLSKELPTPKKLK